MSEQQTPTSAKGMIDKEQAKKLGIELERGLAGVAAAFKQNMAAIRERNEVGALFELYRQRRDADGPRSPDRDRRGELDGMLRAALAGYDTKMLSDLITFGQWVSETAQPVWESRPVR